MTRASRPILYSKRADLWVRLNPYSVVADEVEEWLELVYDALPARLLEDEVPLELLEIGSGAGLTTQTLVRNFEVTTIELSPEMVRKARRNSTEAVHIQGDMRTFDLPGQSFHVVTVADSIDYLTTREDVKATLARCFAHLKPGGVLLVAPSYTTETFPDRGDEDSEIRDRYGLLRFVSLVRRSEAETFQLELLVAVHDKDKMEIIHDRHTCGLFPLDFWRLAIAEAGFEIVTDPVDLLSPDEDEDEFEEEDEFEDEDEDEDEDQDDEEDGEGDEEGDGAEYADEEEVPVLKLKEWEQGDDEDPPSGVAGLTFVDQDSDELQDDSGWVGPPAMYWVARRPRRKRAAKK